jgi:predicted transposase YbfD/YdcC
LSLPNGIPSHDTFNRVFQALDPKEFQQAFLNWTQTLRAAIPGEIVAMEGKALRRALTQSKNPRYIVSAWAEDNGLVLGQLKVDEKTNEITAVPQLLRALELSGCIVTLDAMGCQKNIAKEIKDADADYVLALKGNQATVHQEVKAFLDETIAEANAERPPGVAPSLAAAPLVHKKVVEKDHGRLETREFRFGEDQSRARTGYAAENLATLRRLALNLLKSEKTKNRGIRGKQNNASWDHAYLLRLLGI